MSNSEVPSKTKLRIKAKKSNSVERLEDFRIKKEDYLKKLNSSSINESGAQDIVEITRRFQSNLDEDSSLAQEHWANGGRGYSGSGFDFGIKIEDI